MRLGNHVFFIDYEDDEHTIAERFRLLGVADELVESFFWFFADPGAMGEVDQEWLLALAEHVHPAVVVFDSMNAALTANGARSYNDGHEIERFLARVPRPFARAGAAVVIVDHVNRNGGNTGSGKSMAGGSERKHAGIKGSALEVQAVEEPVIGGEGKVNLYVAKDNHSQLKRYAVGKKKLFAVAHFNSRRDGHLTIKVVPPAPEEAKEDRYERLDRERDERIATLLEAGPLSMGKIQEAVGGDAARTGRLEIDSSTPTASVAGHLTRLPRRPTDPDGPRRRRMGPVPRPPDGGL